MRGTRHGYEISANAEINGSAVTFNDEAFSLHVRDVQHQNKAIMQYQTTVQTTMYCSREALL